MNESQRPLAALCLWPLLLLLLPSCASIVSNSTWPVAITAYPSNANVEVRNSDGVCVHYGRTPCTVMLPSGNGWFAAATYHVRATSDAGAVTERELRPHVNGWYFGNLLFPGLIGLLIVDPLTGAMYRLPATLTIRCGAARP
jgi:hypothetical protein